MRLIARRKAADAAFAQVRMHQRIWRVITHDSRAWCVRHRAGVIVGGGFFAGLGTSLLPVAPLLRLASAFAGTASLMLEGPFLRLLSAAQRDASRARRACGADAVTPSDPTIETLAAAPTALAAPVIAPSAPVDPPTTEPPVEAAASTPQLRNRLQIAIVVILLLYTCAIAEAVIVPVLIAVLFGLMLAPPVRFLDRSRVPRALSSLLMVLIAIAIIGGAISALASPARAWVGRMPNALARIETVMKDLRRPFQMATDATRELGKMTQMDGSAPVRVVDSGPSPFAAALSAAPAVIGGIVITIVLTFLFLLHGDELLRKFVTLAPHLRAKRDLVEATRTAQSEISMYVITVTLINAGLGLATALALWLLHVRDPLLWGGVAALLNYAPFIGPMVTAVALLVVGFAEAATPALALAPPAAFLGLHLLEGQLLTPHLVGRRLALDPVMVFISMLVLGWMWGVAGFLLAVPLLTCAKIIAERSEGGDTMVALLSRHTGEARST